MKPRFLLLVILLILGMLFVACSDISTDESSSEETTTETEEVVPEEEEADPEAEEEAEDDSSQQISYDLEPYNSPTLTEGDNCAAIPDGSGFTSEFGGFTSEFGGFTSEFGGIAQEHGILVWEIIRHTLDENGFLPSTESPTPDSVYLLVIDQFSLADEEPTTVQESWSKDGLNIQLVPIDIKDFETNAIVNKSRAKMKELIDLGASRFVLNMSWIILPCSLEFPENIDEYVKVVCEIENEEDLEAVEGLNEIAEFLDSLTAGEHEEFCNLATGAQADFLNDYGANQWVRYWLTDTEKRTEIEQWEESLEEDPFIRFLGCFTEQDYTEECQEGNISPSNMNVISVAAAGNASKSDEGLVIDYPLFPGQRNNVVSVSALDDEGTLASKSNYGEIAMDGLYLTEVDRGAWTSFAAPRFSTYGAIHLAHGRPSPCDPNNSIYPPLGYVTEITSTFNNLTLATAVPDYCPNFLDP